MSDAGFGVIKSLRLTNRAITSAIGCRGAITRFGRTGARIAKTIAKYRQISDFANPLLTPIQAWLDNVNGRAKARTISTAREVLDCAIKVEYELRSKGVTVKNMKGTTVLLRGNAGFINVSTGVNPEYRATGWYVRRITRTYGDRGNRFVSITPAARADIINLQLHGYGQSTVTDSK